MPQVAGPTLRGEDAIPTMTLANQEYVRGEIQPDPTPAPTAPPVEAPQPPTPPAPESSTGRCRDTPPAEMNAENRGR